MASNTTLATVSLRPSGAQRVSSRITPTIPTPIRKFDGSSMRPSVLERKKNTAKSFWDAFVTRSGRPGNLGAERQIAGEKSRRDLADIRAGRQPGSKAKNFEIFDF